MKGVMIQGTASDVGKSLIVTAFCRILKAEGYKVSPFKSQNMSNNSYVTIDGKEIGRAQGIQAEAAGVEATVWMNPILLKPRSDLQSEVVVFGEVDSTLSGRSYRENFYEKGKLIIIKSLKYLAEHYDVVVMEGAGSPVEINLKDRELVNMKVAEMADIPVILVADIDRGGVFASIVGTIELLTETERKRVKGIIINKFRGDPSLFEDGISWIEEKTNIPILGVIPYIHSHMIEGEDSLSIREKKAAGSESLDIVVIKHPYLSNYSDIEPFFQEEDVSIRLVEHAEEFGNPDAVIIPGTKSTIHDLETIYEKGLAKAIKQYCHQNGRIIGICGGYQMLCGILMDPNGTDTGKQEIEVAGLGIIPAKTIFKEQKQTIRVNGSYHKQTGIMGNLLEGYEIHLGETDFFSPKDSRPFLLVDGHREEGYYANKGRVIGTYMHHLFHNDEWRSIWLNEIRKEKGYSSKETLFIQVMKQKRFDKLAMRVKEHLDWEKVSDIIAGDSQL